jgi:hypothetical protein
MAYGHLSMIGGALELKNHLAQQNAELIGKNMLPGVGGSIERKPLGASFCLRCSSMIGRFWLGRPVFVQNTQLPMMPGVDHAGRRRFLQ